MRKYRLFGKVNIFDIILVAVVIAIVYGAYVFAMPGQVAADNSRLVRFTVEFGEQREGFHAQIEPGALVIDSRLDVAIGHVVSAYSLPFLRDVQDEYSNIWRRTPVEGLEFTYVVIETNANVTDSLIEVNGFRIMVNTHAGIRSRDFAGYGFIVRIEFVD